MDRSSTSRSLTSFVSRYGNNLPLIVRLTVDQSRPDVPAVWLHTAHMLPPSSIGPRVSYHSKQVNK